MAQHVYPEEGTGFFNAYLDAKQRPHGYLIMHLTQDTNDGLRFTTDKYPTEYHPIVNTDKGDEVCEI